MSEETKPLVGVIMGSHSDWSVMENCAKQLKDLGVPYEAKVISAHRTPELLHRWVNASTENGMEVIIAAAGGAAHLAGVTAAITSVPVLAVPMKAWSTEGLDSLLSMVQMPGACRSALWRSVSPAPRTRLCSPRPFSATNILSTKRPTKISGRSRRLTVRPIRIYLRFNIFCVEQIFYWRLRCGRARKGPFPRAEANLYIFRR